MKVMKVVRIQVVSLGMLHGSIVFSVLSRCFSFFHFLNFFFIFFIFSYFFQFQTIRCSTIQKNPRRQKQPHLRRRRQGNRSEIHHRSLRTIPPRKGAAASSANRAKFHQFKVAFNIPNPAGQSSSFNEFRRYSPRFTVIGDF